MVCAFKSSRPINGAHFKVFSDVSLSLLDVDLLIFFISMFQYYGDVMRCNVKRFAKVKESTQFGIELLKFST